MTTSRLEMTCCQELTARYLGDRLVTSHSLRSFDLTTERANRYGGTWYRHEVSVLDGIECIIYDYTTAGTSVSTAATL